MQQVTPTDLSFLFTAAVCSEMAWMRTGQHLQGTSIPREGQMSEQLGYKSEAVRRAWGSAWELLRRPALLAAVGWGV